MFEVFSAIYLVHVVARVSTSSENKQRCCVRL